MQQHRRHKRSGSRARALSPREMEARRLAFLRRASSALSAAAVGLHTETPRGRALWTLAQDTQLAAVQSEALLADLIAAEVRT
jgi:hypothetical protein